MPQQREDGMRNRRHGVVPMRLFFRHTRLDLPRLPTANTNIPVIMAAEKISDALLRHH